MIIDWGVLAVYTLGRAGANNNAVPYFYVHRKFVQLFASRHLAPPQPHPSSPPLLEPWWNKQTKRKSKHSCASFLYIPLLLFLFTSSPPHPPASPHFKVSTWASLAKLTWLLSLLFCIHTATFSTSAFL
jgi:hypothetical protein